MGFHEIMATLSALDMWQTAHIWEADPSADPIT